MTVQGILKRKGRRGAAVFEPLLRRAAGIPLLRDLSRRDLLRLLAQAQWFGLPGGWVLFREGDPAHAVHIVLAGRLAATVVQPDGRCATVGEVNAGETVGEMAIFSGAPRSATLVALRDSELLRLPRPAFEALLDRHPPAVRQIGRVMTDRLARATHPAAAVLTPRTIAFIPLSADPRLVSLARELSLELAKSGRRCSLIGPGNAGRPPDWFHALETRQDHVIYQADDAGSAWGRQCIRQADRILFAAAAGEAPPGTPLALVPERVCDLALLHGPDTARPRGAAPWLGALPTALHCHVRQGSRSDVARLARLVTGRALGVVLSGGGARGFAHIGVLKAMREVGMPVDMIGGASMGAIAAAGVALEWSDAEFRDRMRGCFVESNPLGDIALPLVALSSGRRVTRRLRRHFGGIEIEDLWRPYFAVSANLTTGRQHRHRSGPLWHALRASVAIPGLLPPVVEDGEILVDGATLNNLPVDVMAAMGRGPVVGCDAGRARCVGDCGDAPAVGVFSGLMRRLRGGAPGLVEILMRAGTVSSDAHTESLRGQVDLLFEPPVGAFDLRDWKAFDRIVEAGYRHAAGILARADVRARLRHGP